MSAPTCSCSAGKFDHIATLLPRLNRSLFPSFDLPLLREVACDSNFYHHSIQRQHSVPHAVLADAPGAIGFDALSRTPVIVWGYVDIERRSSTKADGRRRNVVADANDRGMLQPEGDTVMHPTYTHPAMNPV